ncbi:MAG: DUF362 domain-containing protein [Phycisphaerae bacterium]|nr:DUF362 domain-containing protein [Phycisphaerae bacterium]
MESLNRARQIDRRSFLQGVATGVACSPLASLAAAEGDRSRVIVAERDDFGRGADINRQVVKQAVDAMVKALSGKANVDEAWRTFVSPKETVAMKSNGQHRGGSTSPALVWAVCRGLVDAGVPEQKIIVLDRNQQDFQTWGVKTFEDMPKVRFVTADSAWDTEVKVGPVKTRLTRVLTRDADAIFNLPCLKNHVIAGVTIAMKNHMGSIPNPQDLHGNLDAIAELNCLPPIRGKTRLAICDAIVGILDGGPQYRGSHCTWPAKSLLAATDVVALDAVGAEMVRKARKAKGLRGIKPDPRHIAHAAEIGLGTADLGKIDTVRV